MKLSNWILLSVIVNFCVACKVLNPQAVCAKKVDLSIQNRDFTIAVSRVFPFRMEVRTLSPEYYLRVKGDSAYATLPYYGVAQVAPVYPNVVGIRFAELISDYRFVENKSKERCELCFSAVDNSLKYRFYVYVYENGNAEINISFPDRDPICYQGELTF